MAYGDFTEADIQQRFGLTIVFANNLYAAIAPVPPPAALTALLARNFPFVMNLRNEKARSEFLIAPLLAEFKFCHPDELSLFTGVAFDVDPAEGLVGWCDYLLSRSANQIYVTAPVCVVVEAKREDIVAGVPQCLAEMVAARRFNDASGNRIPVVHGVISSGDRWRFLRLDGTVATIDGVEHSITDPAKIFGILTHITGV